MLGGVKRGASCPRNAAKIEEIEGGRCRRRVPNAALRVRVTAGVVLWSWILVGETFDTGLIYIASKDRTGLYDRQ